MNDSYPSQEYLDSAFTDLADKLEQKLVNDIADNKLWVDIGERETSPIVRFIDKTKDACDELIKPPRQAVRARVASIEETEAKFFDELQKAVENKRPNASRATEKKLAADLQKMGAFKGLAMADDLVYFTHLKNFDYAVQQVMEQRTWRSTARHFATQFRESTGIVSGGGHRPTEADWESLQAGMLANIGQKACGCSLIYSYWLLDEAGLSIAFERIADRVENGVVSTTQALKMLHVDEADSIVDIVSTFIASWQRGELFDVDARRKQYQAQYGFPLLAAKAWNGLSTGDPRAIFPGAFHRFLYEANQYYEAQRDLMKQPLIEGFRTAVAKLLDALREGNENLRKRRTAHVRGQTEYLKRVLGGSVSPAPLANEWKKYLPGRPGITNAPDSKPYQAKADAVASAYGWNRPRIKDYSMLAEAGETILVATRIGGQTVVDDPGAAKAFAELMRKHVLNYINAFKVVGGVDLGKQLITAPPATIMARKITPPTIPPLKRHWGAVTPGDVRNNAA